MKIQSRISKIVRGVITEILNKLNFGKENTAAPLNKVELIEKCKNYDGLVIDLFKKAQDSGLREIYV